MPVTIPFRNHRLSVKMDLSKDGDAPVLLLAHGANGGMDHPLLQAAASGLCDRGVSVIRFNFPYAQEGKNSPNSDTVLEECWDAVVRTVSEKFPDQPLVIGGKSLGGRTAAQYCNNFGPGGIRGLLFLGFPLHAPGRRSAARGGILSRSGIPCFLAQGSRDALADIDLIRELTAKEKRISLYVVDGGDHSLRQGKNGGDQLTELWDSADRWIRNL